MERTLAGRGAFGGQELGFTLLEMLVGLALMALIASLIVAGIQSGAAMKRHIEVGTGSDEIATAQMFLRNLIGETRPSGSVATDATPVATLSGTPQTLTVISSYTVAAQFAGLYVSTLSVDHTEDGKRADLILRQMPYRPFAAPAQLQTAATRNILLRNVHTLTFRYFANRPGQPQTWLPAWSDASALPSLVSIEVTFPEGDPRHWSPLTIEPILRDR